MQAPFPLLSFSIPGRCTCQSEQIVIVIDSESTVQCPLCCYLNVHVLQSPFVLDSISLVLLSQNIVAISIWVVADAATTCVMIADFISKCSIKYLPTLS